MGFLRIPRFFAGQRIVKDDGAATNEFLRALNDTLANVQSAVNSIKKQTDDIEFSLQQAGIAITTAEEVRAELLAKSRADALKESWVDPNQVLSSDIDPDDAALRTITIADHTRRYGDGSSVEVTGASEAGLPAGALIFVYYDDQERTGGAVDYLFTTNEMDAVQGAGDSRHVVGYIVTPADGATDGTTGGGTTPSGVPPREGGYKAQQPILTHD